MQPIVGSIIKQKSFWIHHSDIFGLLVPRSGNTVSTAFACPSGRISNLANFKMRRTHEGPFQSIKQTNPVCMPVVEWYGSRVMHKYFLICSFSNSLCFSSKLPILCTAMCSPASDNIFQIKLEFFLGF